MALIAQHTQHSIPSCSSKSVQPPRAIKLRSTVAFRSTGGNLSKSQLCLSVRSRATYISSKKPFKVFSFKGKTESGDSNSMAEETICSKPFQFSYTSHPTGAVLAGSRDKYRKFSRWLLLLWSSTPVEKKEEITVERGVAESEKQESSVVQQQTPTKQTALKILKVVSGYFLRLDAEIKLPLMIFIPIYIGVKIRFGEDVVKDLLSLWISGPIVTFYYVKAAKWVLGLYVYTFQKIANAIKSTPGVGLAVYGYVKDGKLQAELSRRYLQPVVDFKNQDHKALLRLKLEELKEELKEKRLDWIESVWPYYCRLMRSLKIAKIF